MPSDRVAAARGHDGRSDAERAYERVLAELVARGTRLPADPAHRWAIVSIFAERYGADDLDEYPDLLWECEEEGRAFLRDLKPAFRRELRRPPKSRHVFIVRARPRSSRGGPRAQRTRRTTRTAAASGDPSPEGSEPSRRPVAALLAGGGR
jgi:hypothetical protein